MSVYDEWIWWVNECICKWMSVYVSEWVYMMSEYDEWMSVYVSEWVYMMSDWVYMMSEWVYM